MNVLYSIQGKVRDGKKRGKNLGFPTINIPLTTQIPEGIYVSHAIVDSQTYQALTFVGAAITFGETEVISETYLLTFNQDIYGKKVVIELLKKLRENIKFETPEELVTQMKIDQKNAEEFFNEH